VALARDLPDEGSDAVLAEGVLRLLRLVAGETGCLLLLEDLHWADAETMSVVEYLADNLAAERVLCVGTLRPGEHSTAEHLLGQLTARRVAGMVELSALGAAQVETIAAACLRTAELPPRVGISSPIGRRASPSWWRRSWPPSFQRAYCVRNLRVGSFVTRSARSCR
jgi:hypothetical protein